MRSSHLKKISLGLFGSLFLTGCSSDEISGLGFEAGVTSVNDEALSLWQGAWIAAGVVGIVTLVLILWPVFFHRKKNEEFPKQTHENNFIEITFIIIPFLIVRFCSISQ